MLEFRFHGRGGQGVVILGKLVARLFFQLQKHVKEFPKFGVERRGAPVEGYVRVDEDPINLNCQIYEPDSIVVMSETILEGVDVTAGLKPGSLILVNSPDAPAAFADRLPGYRVATADADGIALAHGLGTALAPISNTSLFGAFAKLVNVQLDGVEESIRGQIKHADKNVIAARAAYEAVCEPVLLPGEPIKRPAPQLPFKTLDALPELGYSLTDASRNKTGAWRSQRPAYAFRRAPCNAQCPAGNDVRGFLEALAADDPKKALGILLETTPFPGVCGRVCPHPCEDECNRAEMDSAVSVRALERFAAAHGGDLTKETAPSTGRRVAVVGAGPGGLSAAWQLARRGHKVVVYEAAPEPGGMLVLGIPGYRLPRDLLEQEIGRILGLGVELRCNTRLGKEIQLADLREEYDAVLLAVGQMISVPLRIPGKEIQGIDHGLEFLRKHNLGEEVHVGEKVIVIGGGNTAIDVAGVAMRKSATRDVSVVYRRSKSQMPAIPEEIEHALAEGAKLTELTAPVEAVAGPDGRIRALVCDKMKLGEPDASGRPRPVVIPDSRHEIECDQLILAIGQWTDLEFAGELKVADDHVHTTDEKIYACGDASTGEGTVTAAIGSGRAAALAIHAALGGELPEPHKSWAPLVDEVLRFDRINANYFDHIERAKEPRLPVEKRLTGWKEVVGEIPDACAEAARCFSCGTCTGCDNCYIYCPEPCITREGGTYTIDFDYCKGCGVCMEECPRGVVNMGEDHA